jgi:hypothetical protein
MSREDLLVSGSIRQAVDVATPLARHQLELACIPFPCLIDQAQIL